MNMNKDVKAFEAAINALEEQEPCEDAISRAEVRRILGSKVLELMRLHTVNQEDNPKADSMAYGVNWGLNTLMELPSVTPKQKTGHWVKINPYPMQMHDYRCSECYHETDDNTENYCSECGARMEDGT